MKHLTRTFLTGLVTVLPVVATAYLLMWLAVTTEALLGGLIRLVLPPALYWPGLGMVLGIVAVFLIGLAMRTWVARKVFAWAEALLLRLPLVKSVYGALRDFFGFLTASKEQGLQQVVTVRLGDTDLHLVGFLTRTDLTGLPKGIGEPGRVAVYLPMSYQIGGYTLLAPREAVQPVEMSLEEAMRFALTAGLSTTALKSAPGGGNA